MKALVNLLICLFLYLYCKVLLKRSQHEKVIVNQECKCTTINTSVQVSVLFFFKLKNILYFWNAALFSRYLKWLVRQLVLSFL